MLLFEHWIMKMEKSKDKYNQLTHEEAEGHLQVFFISNLYYKVQYQTLLM